MNLPFSAEQSLFLMTDLLRIFPSGGSTAWAELPEMVVCEGDHKHRKAAPRKQKRTQIHIVITISIISPIFRWFRTPLDISTRDFFLLILDLLVHYVSLD
jgi:hypothetical protein